MNKLVIGVHGWNVRDRGNRTVDKSRLYFERLGWDYDGDSADYGYIFWMMFSWIGRMVFAKRIIRQLTPALKKADLIITHSNGANFVNKALKYLGPEYDNTKIVVHVSPALNKKTEPAAAIKAQLVIHTRRDIAVKLGAWVPASSWGSMGAYGYMGYSKVVLNKDYTNYSTGHSDYWHKPILTEMVVHDADDFYERNTL